MTVLEWLRARLAGRSARNLEDQVAKVRCLGELGARRLVLTALPLAGLDHFAATTASRKLASLFPLAEPRRTLEFACFFRLQLVRLTDTGLALTDHRIADLSRGARDRAEASEAAQLRRYRRLVADLVHMVPRLDADSVGVTMARLRAKSRLRAANDDIVAFMRDHSVVELWDDGMFASADMTSLDATRHLWAAWLDPRRRAFAVGSYTHVLDQWGIVYDQPILRNRRQAGAAIEGALRQRHVLELERVAVDTHGHAHFAMALAKLTGFDLCPRLARLKTRKLYLPRGLDVPENLRPIVAQTVSRRAIVRGWDGLARFATSVREGWLPATEALERFGAAARGDLVHAAGDALGKLLRTLYLCDYLGSPAFRDEILALLNKGEAVRSLQRAIQQGPLPEPRSAVGLSAGATAMPTNHTPRPTRKAQSRRGSVASGGRSTKHLAMVAKVISCGPNNRDMVELFSALGPHSRIICCVLRA